MLKTAAFFIVVLSWIPISYSGTIDALQSQLDSLSTEEQLSLLQSKQLEIDTYELLAQVKYWHMLGMSQDLNRQTDEAEQSFTTAINIFEQNKLALTTDLPLAYIERSYMKYIKTHDVDVYCPDRVEALRLIRQLSDNTLLVKILVQNAFCYSNDVSKFNQGLGLLNEAIAVAEENNLPKHLHAMIYNASGNLYRNNHALDSAYEYIEKAHDIWDEVDDYNDMFSMQHILVSLAINMKRYSLAKQHVDQLFSMAKQHSESNDFMFFAFYNAGLLALAQSEFNEAILQFQEAKKRQDTTQEKFFVKKTYQYLIIAAFRQGMHDVSKAALQDFERVYGQSSSDRELNAITHYYEGNYEAALTALYTQLDGEVSDKRDFVNQLNLSSKMLHNESLLKLDNQILQQTIEINKLMLAEQQNKNQIAYLYVSLIGLFVIGLLLFIVHLMITRKKFKQNSETDYLTGIANRRFSIEQGERFLAQAQQVQQDISILIFDIDHFKKVNDLLGHEVGDIALKLVVRRALVCLRKKDLIGRIGGEEFLVILRDTNKAMALDIAERIRLEIAKEQLEFNRQTMPLSVSIGVASLQGEELLDQIMARADQALYQAKNEGRNQVFSA